MLQCLGNLYLCLPVVHSPRMHADPGGLRPGVMTCFMLWWLAVAHALPMRCGAYISNKGVPHSDHPRSPWISKGDSDWGEAGGAEI